MSEQIPHVQLAPCRDCGRCVRARGASGRLLLSLVACCRREVSARVSAYILLLYFTRYPLLSPSQIEHPSRPPANDSSHAPWTDPGLGLTKQPALYYCIVLLGPSLASRRQRLEIQQGLHVRRSSLGLRKLRRTRCRNRPVLHSRRLE